VQFDYSNRISAKYNLFILQKAVYNKYNLFILQKAMFTSGVRKGLQKQLGEMIKDEESVEEVSIYISVMLSTWFFFLPQTLINLFKNIFVVKHSF